LRKYQDNTIKKKASINAASLPGPGQSDSLIQGSAKNRGGRAGILLIILEGPRKRKRREKKRGTEKNLASTPIPIIYNAKNEKTKGYLKREEVNARLPQHWSKEAETAGRKVG